MADHDSPNREQEICQKALEIASPEERLGYLKGACGDNLALLARVQASLQAHKEEKRSLPNPPQDALTIVGITEKSGDKIGRYQSFSVLCAVTVRFGNNS